MDQLGIGIASGVAQHADGRLAQPAQALDAVDQALAVVVGGDVCAGRYWIRPVRDTFDHVAVHGVAPAIGIVPAGEPHARFADPAQHGDVVVGQARGNIDPVQRAGREPRAVLQPLNLIRRLVSDAQVVVRVAGHRAQAGCQVVC